VRPVDFSLTVEFAPPVKQTPADAAERVGQAALSEAIALAFAEQHPSGWAIHPVGVDLELTIRYQRAIRRSDAANIIGGIADQLERLGVYRSDSQLRRIDYQERRSADSVDRYSVIVRPMGPGSE
jgi:hypothetical protein